MVRGSSLENLRMSMFGECEGSQDGYRIESAAKRGR